MRFADNRNSKFKTTFIMRKLILALSAVALLGTAAQAQKIDKEALLKKIEKNETAATDAKKAGKAATWLALGKSYVDAVVAPTKDLYVGELSLELGMRAGDPTSIDEAIIGGMSVAAQNYDYVTVYVADGQVIGWTENAPVVDGALDKAIAALNKAYELDAKQAPKVREQLLRISNYCSQLGDACNNVGEYKLGSEAFETAFRAECSPAIETSDASRLYYAGYLATAAGESDSAMYAHGADLLNKALELGFIDDAGQIYYYLFHCYYGQREADRNNVLKAKDALMTGIMKFPKNQDILKSLIMLYSMEEGMGDPTDLVTMLDEAIANDPENIELWFSRAQIFVSMEDYDEAIASLRKAIELDPQSYEAQFFSGYYIVMKADAFNTVINEKGYTSTEEYEADQQKVLAIYSEAVPFLEAAHAIAPQNPDPIQLLKNLCFRLRDEQGMQAKYDKYNALYQQMR